MLISGLPATVYSMPSQRHLQDRHGRRALLLGHRQATPDLLFGGAPMGLRGSEGLGVKVSGFVGLESCRV